jgi:autotransporter-associated beta strand protein
MKKTFLILCCSAFICLKITATTYTVTTNHDQLGFPGNWRSVTEIISSGDTTKFAATALNPEIEVADLDFATSFIIDIEGQAVTVKEIEGMGIIFAAGVPTSNPINITIKGLAGGVLDMPVKILHGVNVVSGGFTLDGPITLILSKRTPLSSNNSFIGGVTIEQGVLQLNYSEGLGSGSLTMSGDGGIATIKLADGIGPTNPIALSTGKTGNFDVEGTESATLNGKITGEGGFVKIGTGTLVVTDPVNSYSGGTSVSEGTLTIHGSQANLGNITLNTTSTADPVTSIFDISEVTTSGTQTITDLNSISGSIVKLGANILTIGTTTPTTTVAGIITGDTGVSLNKIGSGTVILSGVNTFSGGVTLTDGTLALGNDQGLGVGDLTMSTNTTLTINNTINPTNTIHLTGGVIGNFNVGSTDKATLSGVIDGSGSFTKIGTGELVLTNASNSYSGGTIITDGTLAITAPLTNSSSVVVNTPTSLTALFDINGMPAASELTITDLTTGSGSLINLGSHTLIFGTDTSTTIAGIIEGDNGSLTKLGNSTVTLSGANTFTGGIALNGGTINLDNNSGLGNGGILLMGDDTTLIINDQINTPNNISVVEGGTRYVSVPAAKTGTLSGAITGSSIIEKKDAGILVLSGANNYSGETVITEGRLTITGLSNTIGDVTVNGSSTFIVTGSITSSSAVTVNDSSTFDISGMTPAGNLTITDLNTDSGSTMNLGANTLTFGTGNATTVAGVINGITTSTSSGSLIKQDSGTLILSGENTFPGGIEMTAGGIILSNNTGLGTGHLTMSPSTFLTLAVGTKAANSILLTTQGARIFNVGTGNTALLSGNIGGSGSLEKKDSGTLELTGTNSYSGGTVITQGILALIDGGSLNGAASVSVLSTFDISGVSSAQTIGDLDTENGSEVKLGAKSLTFGAGGDKTLSGIISGDAGGSLTKKGTGTTTLTGANTFLGATTVSEGTLVVNSELLGIVSVASSAALKGIGSIGGKTTVKSGGSLRPGNSIGTITLGSLTLDKGSTTQIEFDEAATSLIKVTGDAALAGTLNLIQNPGNYLFTDSYEILTANAVSGTFDAITGGLAGFRFSLDYTNTTVNLTYSSPIGTDGLTGNLLEFANYLNIYAPVSDDFNALAALNGESLYNALNSASPARNAFPTYVTQIIVFSLSHKVSNYLSTKRFLNSHDISGEVADICMSNKNGLVASTNYWDYSQSPPQQRYTFWMAGFVDQANQSSENLNLPFDFMTGGVIAGLDYQSEYKENILGINICYANTQVEDQNNMGSSDISSLAASLYADYVYGSLYIQGIFWGVLQQINNQRIITYPGVNTKATANFTGWQINPHLEIGYTLGSSLFEIQPYIAVDYVENHQDHYVEKGAGSLNMSQKAQKSSMLQTEVGIKFYQGINRSNYSFGVKEDISLINRVPFDTGTVTTSIFGAQQFVTLTSFTEIQTLGAFKLVLFAEMGKEKDTVISIGYEGQFGNQYMSNGATLTLSHVF